MVEHSDTWKIALLGPSAAGKTCYLGSLYAFHSNTGADAVLGSEASSFFISATDSHTRGGLASIAERLLSTPIQLPAQTEGLRDYNICLNIGEGYGVIKRPLQLIDHRGEALQGSADRVQAEQFDNLIAQLMDSDAFIVFASAEHLLMQDVHARANAMAWGTITDILSGVAARLSERDFLPVVFAISKSDLVETGAADGVEDALQSLLRPLSSRLVNTPFYICPISVIKEIDSDRRVGPPRFERNLRNLAAPFLFASAGVVLRNAAIIAEDASSDREAKDELRAALKTNTGGSFWSRAQGLFGKVKKLAQLLIIDRRINRKVQLTNNDVIFAKRAISLLNDSSVAQGTRFVVGGEFSSVDEFITARARRAML